MESRVVQPVACVKSGNFTGALSTWSEARLRDLARTTRRIVTSYPARRPSACSRERRKEDDEIIPPCRQPSAQTSHFMLPQGRVDHSLYALPRRPRLLTLLAMQVMRGG